MLNPEFDNAFCTQLINLEGQDDAALAFIEQCYAAHPDDIDHIKDLVSDVSGFYGDTVSPALRAAFAAADKRQHFIDDIMRQSDGDPNGIELSNGRGQYALLLRDASNPGMVRYQCFDQYGFCSHHSERDWVSAIGDAWLSGFKIVVTGALDSLSAQPEFFESLHRSRSLSQ